MKPLLFGPDGKPLRAEQRAEPIPAAPPTSEWEQAEKLAVAQWLASLSKQQQVTLA